MKIYLTSAGEPGAVYVSENGVRRALPGGPFAWGEKHKSDPRATALAKALLLDLIGEEIIATRLHMRFKWRTIAAWPEQFGFTDAELQAQVAAIQETEVATAQSRTMASQAPAPVVSEADRGPAGRPVEWDATGEVGVYRPGPKK